MSKAQPIKPAHLPQYVGYRHVCDALVVSRRTVERMVREGKFPSPVQLSPNRVGWQAETVTAWLDERGKGLVAHAVAHPQDLEPDQLVDSARDLIAEAMSKRTGKPVDPAGMSVYTTRAVTMDEFKAAEAREFALLAKRFAHFGEGRAVVLAAWLFPALRPLFEDGAIDEAARKLFQSPEALRELGSRALHDDDWDEAEAGLLAAGRPVN
jgi:prophage regulatory protein